MTVWELIKELEKYDTDTKVYIKADWIAIVDIVKDDTFINDRIILF